MTNKKPKIFKLSEEARNILTQLKDQQQHGLSETAVIEKLLRQEWRRHENKQKRHDKPTAED